MAEQLRIIDLVRPILKVGCYAVSSLLVLPILYLIEPFYRIRLTPLHTARIGHMAMNTQRFVARRMIDGPEPRTWRIIFGARPCNIQLMTMWKQRLPIVESTILTAFYHYAREILGKTRFFQPLEGEMYHYAEINHDGPLLKFSGKEEEAGRKLLETMGMTNVLWFVCFYARDAAYHRSRGHPETREHRNSRIETYLKAAEHIAAQGGAAVRLGAAVDSPLPSDIHPRIIDYGSRFRTDFGDIYLIAKCRFFLASAGGVIHVAPIFKTPVAAVNMFPHLPAPTGRHSLYIPKLMIHVATGKLVTFAESHRAKAFSWQPSDRVPWDEPATFAKHGFSIVDNTAEEILDLCLDMLDKQNNRAPAEEATELQALYKQKFLSNGPYKLDDIPDIGPRFAIKYRDLITAG